MGLERAMVVGTRDNGHGLRLIGYVVRLENTRWQWPLQAFLLLWAELHMPVVAAAPLRPFGIKLG